jgi:hypothetical protein
VKACDNVSGWTVRAISFNAAKRRVAQAERRLVAEKAGGTVAGAAHTSGVSPSSWLCRLAISFRKRRGNAFPFHLRATKEGWLALSFTSAG